MSGEGYALSIASRFFAKSLNWPWNVNWLMMFHFPKLFGPAVEGCQFNWYHNSFRAGRGRLSVELVSGLHSVNSWDWPWKAVSPN